MSTSDVKVDDYVLVTGAHPWSGYKGVIKSMIRAPTGTNYFCRMSLETDDHRNGMDVEVDTGRLKVLPKKEEQSNTMNVDRKKMSLKQLHIESHDRCLDYEELFGSLSLCKLSISASHRLLVKKGLVTERELLEAMLDELDDNP